MFFSEHAPRITMSISGGFFTSFVLTMMVFGDVQPGVSVQHLPDAVNATITVLIALFLVVLLFKASYAVVSETARWL
jgi:hypothetical protein